MVQPAFDENVAYSALLLLSASVNWSILATTTNSTAEKNNTLSIQK